MIGIFPKLEIDRRGLQHHLRYHDSKQPVAGGGDMSAVSSSSSLSPDSGGGSGEDLIAERRRAKAMKVIQY